MIDGNKEKLYLCNRGCVWRVYDGGPASYIMNLVATPNLSRTIRIVYSAFGNSMVLDEVNCSKRRFLSDGKKDLDMMSNTSGISDWAIIKEITQ